MNDYGNTVNSTLEQIGSNIVQLNTKQENMDSYLQEYIDNKTSEDKGLQTCEIVLIIVQFLI